MMIDYDEVRLGNALTDFYNATGISIQLIRNDFTPLPGTPGNHNRYCQRIQSSKEGTCACLRSDRILLERCRDTCTAQMHVCHAGLIDIAVPILYGEEILAYIILGQMKQEVHFGDAKRFLRDQTVDLREMEECYETLPIYDREKIESVSAIAVMLAKYILLENMLKPKFNRYAEIAAAFIRQNLSAPLSVRLISQGTNISKSVLYQVFHESFGCTVSEYIHRVRVEYSIELLREKTLSIEEVAQRAGFSNSAYYCKVFKRQKGIPPAHFRRQMDEKEPENQPTKDGIQ